jgi:hypothetical protein
MSAETMSDTPQTDDLSRGNHFVPTEWSERLERERDKTRAELEMWRDGNILHEVHRNELEKVECERDEAREIIRMAKAKFCEEGSDGNIASEMFSILSGAK